MITARQIEWTAGFLEGEGSFGFYRPVRKDRRWRVGSLAIQATQVQKSPLEKLQSLFGGSLIFVSRPHPRKNIWAWCIRGHQAAGVSMTLYSLMSTRRREQIRVALDAWKDAPGRRGGYKWAA
jgi:hypothetical protein